jgi:cation transport regulator ChaB
MTVSEALDLPEEVERRLTERQRGFYRAIRAMAAVTLQMHKDNGIDVFPIDGLLMIQSCSR